MQSIHNATQRTQDPHWLRGYGARVNHYFNDIEPRARPYGLWRAPICEKTDFYFQPHTNQPLTHYDNTPGKRNCKECTRRLAKRASR